MHGSIFHSQKPGIGNANYIAYVKLIHNKLIVKELNCECAK